MTLPAAGWYPNPENPAEWRWWDGVAWSPYTAPAQGSSYLSSPHPLESAGTTGAFEVEQAIRAALDYLDVSPFSRSGLIEQLEYDGFPNRAAQAAVSSLHISWTDQAKRAAAQYLQSSPFSRSGLIEQLEFEGYSKADAHAAASAAYR